MCLLSNIGKRFQLSVSRRSFATSSSLNTETGLRIGLSEASAVNSSIAKNLEQTSEVSVKCWAERLESMNSKTRLPRSVQAVYLRPLRRKAEYGLPVCDLQLRSYSVRNVEFFTDFAMRAAYYLKLPVSGPVPLPRITERWTFPRSNFVHKKSQENFERITLRRLLQIKDGDPHAVQLWLAFLRRHSFYGVGMKANIWEYEGLGVSKDMDKTLSAVEELLEPQLLGLGRQRDSESHSTIPKILGTKQFIQRSPLTDVFGH